MKKLRTMQEAYRVFELLGIKEVTKPFQKRKGTEVWELPQKTIYNNGHESINRFSIYRNGYIRKMIVSKNGANMSCYQLNKVRKVANFVKDYKWNEAESDMIWTGKYRKIYNNERIMIDTHRDRVVYLCNYILKNYYRKMDLVGEYTVKRMKIIHGEWWRNERKNDTLPFDNMMKELKGNDVQVIINGHRYNLS